MNNERTLQQAIDRMENKGGAGASLRKHLAAAGIGTWEDISRASLYDLRDHLAESVSPGTARTVMARMKALLNRYSDSLSLPSDWQKILTGKNVRPMKIYLSESDLAKIEKGEGVHTVRQQYVLNVFLVCAYTGLRVSDAVQLTRENISGGNLHYIAKKTKKAGMIPLKAGLDKRIEWISAHADIRVSLPSYNEAIRQICRNAGIDEEVVVLKAGKEQRGPKWKYVSSHTARISTASCLNKRGVPIGDISKILQHSGTAMTERYIIRDRVELSQKAMQFFT